MEMQPVVRQFVKMHQYEGATTLAEAREGLFDCLYASANASEMLACWKEIIRMNGLTPPTVVKIEHSSETGRKKAQMEALSEDELLGLIATLREQNALQVSVDDEDDDALEGELN